MIMIKACNLIQKLKSQALILQIPVQYNIQTRQYTVQSAFLPHIIAENVRTLFSMCNAKQYIHIKWCAMCTQNLCWSLHHCRCYIITPPPCAPQGYHWQTDSVSLKELLHAHLGESLCRHAGCVYSESMQRHMEANLLFSKRFRAAFREEHHVLPVLI